MKKIVLQKFNQVTSVPLPLPVDPVNNDAQNEVNVLQNASNQQPSVAPVSSAVDGKHFAKSRDEISKAIAGGVTKFNIVWGNNDSSDACNGPQEEVNQKSASSNKIPFRATKLYTINETLKDEEYEYPRNYQYNPRREDVFHSNYHQQRQQSFNRREPPVAHPYSREQRKLSRKEQEWLSMGGSLEPIEVTYGIPGESSAQIPGNIYSSFENNGLLKMLQKERRELESLD